MFGFIFHFIEYVSFFLNLWLNIEYIYLQRRDMYIDSLLVSHERYFGVAEQLPLLCSLNSLPRHPYLGRSCSRKGRDVEHVHCTIKLLYKHTT